MKNLFAKYVISNSLNERRPLGRFWRKMVSASDDLEQFEKSARELDCLLKRPPQPSSEPPPPTLHSSIMREVRRADAVGARRDTPARPWESALMLRWAGAAALALVLAAGSWWWLNHHVSPTHPESRPPQYVGTESALPSQLPALWTLLDQVSTNGPALLVRPWSRQMEALSNDLHGAAQFLLSSLP